MDDDRLDLLVTALEKEKHLNNRNKSVKTFSLDHFDVNYNSQQRALSAKPENTKINLSTTLIDLKDVSL